MKATDDVYWDWLAPISLAWRCLTDEQFETLLDREGFSTRFAAALSERRHRPDIAEFLDGYFGDWP